MKPRYEDMEIAIMLDSNETAFMVDSEKFGKIYFLKLVNENFPSKDGKWEEATHEKWKRNTNACIECGYAVIYKDPEGTSHLDAIFETQSQFKRKLIRFHRWRGYGYFEIGRN